MRALLWPLIAWWVWDQQGTVVWDTIVEGPLFDRAEWAQKATVVAGTTVEGAGLDSVSSIGEGSASHCGGG